jgi:vacuolar-type H+-ATPase subunit I/STV1
LSFKIKRAIISKEKINNKNMEQKEYFSPEEPWKEYKTNEEGDVLPLEESETDLEKKRKEQAEFEAKLKIVEQEKEEERADKEYIKDLNKNRDEDKAELEYTYGRRRD